MRIIIIWKHCNERLTLKNKDIEKTFNACLFINRLLPLDELCSQTKSQESMVQYDVAATMTYIFGLQQPQVWRGSPMKQVFK